MSLTVKDYKTTSLFNDRKNGREQSGLCWKKNPQGKATDGLAPRRTTPSYLSGSEITAPSKEAQYSRGTKPMRATWDATRKPVSSNIHMDPKFSSSTRSWNNRPSTSDSASKKVKEDKDNEVDIKWTKDDTRFRTCDSVTSSSTPKPPSSDSVPRKPSSSVKNERLSFSQKSIINSIETHKDTVFALTTYNGSTTGSGGVFYSQALFDEYGAIKSWTPWQRKNLVGDFSYQKYIPYSGSHVFMQGETPHAAFQTTWSLNGPWNITINSKKFNGSSSEKGPF